MHVILFYEHVIVYHVHVILYHVHVILVYRELTELNKQGGKRGSGNCCNDNGKGIIILFSFLIYFAKKFKQSFGTFGGSLKLMINMT